MDPHYICYCKFDGINVSVSCFLKIVKIIIGRHIQRRRCHLHLQSCILDNLESYILWVVSVLQYLQSLSHVRKEWTEPRNLNSLCINTLYRKKISPEEISCIDIILFLFRAHLLSLNVMNLSIRWEVKLLLTSIKQRTPFRFDLCQTFIHGIYS